MRASQANELRDVASRAIDETSKHGIRDIRAQVSLSRDVSVTYRQGKPDKVEESSRKGLSLYLYLDGKYTVCDTNDLRPDALSKFISSATDLCKAMSPDRFRKITDPALYENRREMDLKQFDSSIETITPQIRRDHAAALEAATLEHAGKRAISGEATFQDSESEYFQLHSNGFEGGERESQFWSFAEVSIQDEGDRRPSSWASAGARTLEDLDSQEDIGKRAATRALDRLGAAKVATQKTVMVVENQVVPRLLGQLLRATSGRSLQQKESFLEGQVGREVGSKHLTIVDNPFVPAGFGSRLFDSEGISAKEFPVFEKGVLRNFYVDTYYGEKLKMPPTTGSSSNLVIPPGTQTLKELIGEIDHGILVTGFVGGNANPTTGDFSLGVYGTLIEKGRVTTPVSEMNISGNHQTLWSRLVAVGNDPYPFSRRRTPSLVIDAVQFSGT